MTPKARRIRLKVIQNYRDADEHTGLGKEPFLDGYFTCDDCAVAETCRCAFDLYNVYGDCLESK